MATIKVKKNLYDRATCVPVNGEKKHQLMIDLWANDTSLSEAQMWCDLCDDDVYDFDYIVDEAVSYGEFLAESSMENERGN